MVDKQAVIVVIIIFVAIIVIAMLFPNQSNPIVQEMTNIQPDPMMVMPAAPLPQTNCGLKPLNFPIPYESDNYFMLDDGFGGMMDLTKNVCSPQCCAPQWPTGIPQKTNPQITQNLDNYVLNDYYCKGQPGCMCLTKQQATILGNGGQISQK